MPEIVELRERATIERFYRRDPGLHLYELGDLDPFFWPHTTWYGLVERDEPRAMALVYAGSGLPVLILLDRRGDEAAVALFRGLFSRLPAEVYAHLSPGPFAAIDEGWSIEPHGRHLKLELRDPGALAGVPTDDVVRLGLADRSELLQLYREHYPGNAFDPRMLETEQYFGIRGDGRLVCAAGVHVYSPAYGVAALGNVVTAADWRGRGLARRAVARLCTSLRERVEILGLNVKADNHPAIACYRRLGFVDVAPYEECGLRKRG